MSLSSVLFYNIILISSPHGLEPSVFTIFIHINRDLMGHPVFYNVTCIDLRFPERYHEKISYQQYLVLLSELSRRNVKQALSGVRVAPAEISAATYRWVEVGKLSGNNYYIL